MSIKEIQERHDHDNTKWMENGWVFEIHKDRAELLDTLRAEKEASEMVMDSCLKAEAALKRANDMINDSYQCECGDPKTPCPCLEGFLDNIQAILDKLCAS